MGRLHDLKTGVTTTVVKAANASLGKYVGSKIDLEAICAKEDPEKVKAFLRDVVAEKSIPISARNACAILLEKFESGQPIGKAMQETSVAQIQKLETDLKKGGSLK